MLLHKKGGVKELTLEPPATIVLLYINNHMDHTHIHTGTFSYVTLEQFSSVKLKEDHLRT